MTFVADRYDGQPAGVCGCGCALVWVVDARTGEWTVAHVNAAPGMSCSTESLAVA